MMNPSLADPDRLLVEILRYLLQHPDAADTARGVREWWLAGIDPPSANEVEQALCWLEMRDWVRVKRTADGRAVYEANPMATEAIRADLAARTAGQDDPES